MDEEDERAGFDEARVPFDMEGAHPLAGPPPHRPNDPPTPPTPFEGEHEFTLAEVVLGPPIPSALADRNVVRFEDPADRVNLAVHVRQASRDDSITGLELIVGAGARGRVDLFAGHSGHRIAIGRRCKVVLDLRLWRSSTLSIGDETTINHARVICDDADIAIGRDCLLSDELLVQGNDQHALVDLDAMAITNARRRLIEIADHVWIGRRATLMPDARVGRGSVVAAGAVVSRSIGAFVHAAGVPARPVRERSSWSRGTAHVSEGERRFFASNGFTGPGGRGTP